MAQMGRPVLAPLSDLDQALLRAVLVLSPQVESHDDPAAGRLLTAHRAVVAEPGRLSPRRAQRVRDRDRSRSEEQASSAFNMRC
jgi:hypothetical protein